MTVQELITQLKFKVDSAGVKQFMTARKRIVNQMQKLEKDFNVGRSELSAIGRKITLNIDNSPLAQTLRMAQKVNAQLSKMSGQKLSAGQVASGGAIGVKPAVGGGSSRGSGLSAAATGAIAGVAGMAGGMAIGAIMELPRKLIETADITASIDGRMRSITNSAEERYALEQKILDTATASRGAYKESADLFFKLSQSSKQTGLSTEENLKLTETVNKALAVGGASTQEAQATVLQLSQALGSGLLQGDELRSLRENASTLMDGVAEYFGTTIGGLKDMGKEGELTSDKVAQAILYASKKIDKQFENMPMTLGQSATQMENRWTEFVMKFERKSHAFEGLANGISKIGGNLFDGLIKSLDDGSFDAKLNATTRAIVAFGVALGLVKAGEFVKGIGGMAGAVDKLTAAFKKLNKSTVILVVLTAIVYLIQDFMAWMNGDNTGIFGTLFGDFEGAMSKVNSFIDGVKSTFSGLWESLKAAPGNFMQWLQDRFMELGPLMGTPFGILLALLQAIFPEAYYTIVNWMNMAITTIIQFFTVDIPTAVSSFVSFLGSAISSAVSLLVGGFRGGIETVKSFFNDLLNTALGVLDSIGSAISDFISSKIQSAKNAISSLKNFVTGQAEVSASSAAANYNITQNNYGYAADGGAGGVWGY